MENQALKIAVVGAGISGIVTAHVLSQNHRVTLFEKNARLGGHTHTVVIPEGADQGTAVDTGFIVLNDQTYPNFHRFLSQLEVGVRWSCMSFGYYCEETDLAYAGTSLNGLFARRSNVLRPEFWGMLREIKRFSKEGMNALAEDSLHGISLGEFLEKRRFSDFFQKHYLIPISGAIWSCSDKGVYEFPAEMFVRFCHNHGLLSLKNRPRWQTVVGGSHAYLREFEEQFVGNIHLSAEVKAIKRNASGVELELIDGKKEHFDKVVIAAHADEALAMLVDSSDKEQEAFGAWSYSKNRTVLHTHEDILAPTRRAWASWNYRRRAGAQSSTPVSVTYHMNRLQGLQTTKEYCVTLNPEIVIPKDKIVREIEYTHPEYSVDALNSQEKIRQLSGTRNTYFCGAYLGYGFHEDGVNSALEVTKHFGLSL